MEHVPGRAVEDEQRPSAADGIERTSCGLVDHFGTPIAVQIEDRDGAAVALRVQRAWEAHRSQQTAICRIANLDGAGRRGARKNDLRPAVTVDISDGQLSNREGR